MAWQAPVNSVSLQQFERDIGARLARKDLEGASAVAKACRTAWPDEAAGWLLGSIVALLRDDKSKALTLIETRLDRKPADFPCLLQKAETLMALGRRSEALDTAADAADVANHEPAALDAVGAFLVYARAYDRALEVYDRALSIAPDDVSLLARRSQVHRYLGHFTDAVADYNRLLRLKPDDPDALKGVAELSRQTSESNSIESMEAALARGSASSKQAATLHFGLAKSYEDIGSYPDSWRHTVEANRLERGLFDYDSHVDSEVIERIIAGFPDIEAPRHDSTGERPIFILGLPRTGTTLVERILGNHSQVHSAGELSALSEAVGKGVVGMSSGRPQTWGDYASSLPFLDPEGLARDYLEAARGHRGKLPRFSDKQPTNFLYCALILRAFPGATVLHLTRHPLAACYAIYKTRFGGTYPFAYDLTELAKFYVGYRRLMAHWHRVLPGRILDVAYENIVASLESEVKRILTFADLPFEPACLDFHLNRDATATASSVQVRQPLYDSSLSQWRHYEEGLAPVRALLEANGINID